MTVLTETSRVQYIGNGTLGPFAIPFGWIEDVDISVLLTNITTGQDLAVPASSYTLSRTGSASGILLFTSAFGAPSSGWRITIFRDPAITQLLDYVTNDKFPSDSHENGLDRLTMIALRTRELLERSIRFPDGDSPVPTSILAEKALRASRYLAFDSNGDILLTPAITGTPHALQAANFTPTWNGSSGAPPAIGDGEIVGRWLRNANMITVSLYLLAGATTTFGTGTWKFTLPFPAISPTNNAARIGSGAAKYAAGQPYVMAIPRILQSDLTAFTVVAPAGPVNPTNPGAWANGGELLASITYEVAP